MGKKGPTRSGMTFAIMSKPEFLFESGWSVKVIFRIVLILSMVFLVSLNFCDSAFCAEEAVKITGVEFAGLKNVPLSRVQLSLTVKPGDKFAKELVDGNLKRIYDSGYFSDKISVDAVKTSGGVKLVFNVIENPVVKNIAIKGNSLFADKAILDSMQTRQGGVFNHATILSDVRSVQKLFDSKGYVMNRIRDVRFDGETLELIVEENRIEAIKIAGNEKTRDRIILRELRFAAGEVFDDKKVTKSLQRIFNLGYFSEVIPRCEAGSAPGKIDLIISVKESKTGRYTTSGGYSSANGLVGAFEVEEKNLGGRGQSASAMVEFGGRRTYSLGFAEPNVKGENYSLGASVYDTKQDQKLYRPGLDSLTYGESRKGFSISAGRQFSDVISGTLTLRDETVKLAGSENIKSAVEERYIREGRYQTLSSSAARDTRNNYMDPSRGSYSTVNVDSTGGFLKGPDSFIKYGLTLRRYYPLNERDVLAGRISANAISLSSGSVPIYERYGLGGSDNLRGYNYREFAGERMLLGNLEFRHRFSKIFNAHVFYDAGDAWKADGENAVSGGRRGMDIKKGYGAGIVIITPIAPIRFDYARGRSGENRFYFGMGQIF